MKDKNRGHAKANQGLRHLHSKTSSVKSKEQIVQIIRHKQVNDGSVSDEERNAHVDVTGESHSSGIHLGYNHEPYNDMGRVS